MGDVVGTGAPLSAKREEKAKAWLRADGELLTKHELRSVSRSWSKDDWELYLKSLETKQIEYWPAKFDKVLSAHDEASSMIHFHNVDSEARWNEQLERLIPRLRVELSRLENRERQVIRALYFKSQTQRELARQMGVSDHAIRRIRRKALARLTASLQSEESTELVTLPPTPERHAKKGAQRKALPRRRK